MHQYRQHHHFEALKIDSLRLLSNTVPLFCCPPVAASMPLDEVWSKGSKNRNSFIRSCHPFWIIGSQGSHEDPIGHAEHMHAETSKTDVKKALTMRSKTFELFTQQYYHCCKSKTDSV